MSIVFLPETLAAATPAEAAGVGSGLPGRLGWGLDVCRLPFSHLHSAHTPGLRSGERKKTNSVTKRRGSMMIDDLQYEFILELSSSGGTLPVS